MLLAADIKQSRRLLDQEDERRKQPNTCRTPHGERMMMMVGIASPPSNRRNQQQQQRYAPLLSCHNPQVTSNTRSSTRPSSSQHGGRPPQSKSKVTPPKDKNSGVYAGTSLQDMVDDESVLGPVPVKQGRTTTLLDVTNRNQMVASSSFARRKDNKISLNTTTTRKMTPEESDGGHMWDPQRMRQFPNRRPQSRPVHDVNKIGQSRRRRSPQTLLTSRDATKKVDTQVKIHEATEGDIYQTYYNRGVPADNKPPRNPRKNDDHACFPRSALSDIPGWKSSWSYLQSQAHRNMRQDPSLLGSVMLEQCWTKPWCWDYAEHVQQTKQHASSTQQQPREEAPTYDHNTPFSSIASDASNKSASQQEQHYQEREEEPATCFTCYYHHELEMDTVIDQSSIYGSSSSDSSSFDDEDQQSVSFLHSSAEADHHSLMYSVTTVETSGERWRGSREDPDWDEGQETILSEESSLVLFTRETGDATSKLDEEEEDDLSSWKDFLLTLEEEGHEEKQAASEDDHSSIPFEGLGED
uniref:Uncharacterized protein n=1 Tax=Entomoneis paludosa TaxID=265537 RepID=A0A7S2YTZ4_9STRA|mmetsp:Transcript_9980/g.20642  ORF Transcript_9980/g.20642 Transcript_9980/m.20642 type:complete len:525 (+) Transcript_9980:1423-2997(+)